MRRRLARRGRSRSAFTRWWQLPSVNGRSSTSASRYNESLPESMYVTAIIAAGGRGLRLGSGKPKQLMLIDGRPLLEHSVTAFLAHPAVDELVVALPVELAETPPPYLRDRAKPVRVVIGGARRQDSVA